MAKAKDIMTPNPLMLGSGTDILDAVDFFNRHHISTAAVQNPLGQILGQLSEIDLVKALVHYRANSDYSKVIHAQSLFLPVFFVSPEDEIAQVLKVLVKAPSHRVLVKDNKDKVVGIISPKDLLRSIRGTDPVAKVVSDQVKALQIEVSDLRSRIQEMSSYLQTYDTVFQSGLFGLHSANSEGRILFANERLHAILGYPMGELIGRSIFDLYPADAHAQAQEGLAIVLREGRHNLIFAQMKNKNGGVVKVDLASAALQDEIGRFIGTFTISRQHGTEAMNQSYDALFGIKQ